MLDYGPEVGSVDFLPSFASTPGRTDDELVAAKFDFPLHHFWEDFDRRR